MVCDITEITTDDGEKVYFEIIKNLATNQLLPWSIIPAYRCIDNIARY